MANYNLINNLAEHYADNNVSYVFKTHCYSELAAKLVKAFIYYSTEYQYTAMYSDIFNRRGMRGLDRCLLDKEPDGEVVLRVHSPNWGYFDDLRKIFLLKKNDKEAHAHFAWCLKQLCLIRLRQSGIDVDEGKTSLSVFNAKSPQIVKFYTDNATSFEVAVAEVYAFYEILLGRRHTMKKVKSQYIKNIVGEQIDPFTASIEASRREEIIKIKNDIRQTRQALSDEKNTILRQKYNELQAALDIEYQQKLDAAMAEYTKQLKELEASKIFE